MLLGHSVGAVVRTDAGPGRNRGLADPERHPGENHQQDGGNIRLQDKEQHVSTQCKV